MTTLLPTIYRVNLAAFAHEDQARESESRAQAVLKALPSAERQLGTRPTHVIASPKLLINMETLEGAGLAVLRRPRAYALERQVDLAVEEVREPAPLGQLRML
jgi:hypothetical protein